MPYLDTWESLDIHQQPMLRQRDMDRLNAEGSEAFIKAHPEFYQCDENAQLLEAWLYLHNDAPFTRLNLELAQRALANDLKTAPPPEAPVLDKWAGVTLSRSDALLEYQPSEDEQDALAKLADDSSLNDHQRKARLNKLKLLAGKQRREFSDLKPGADPALRI
jgi:hypothetical protein